MSEQRNPLDFTIPEFLDLVREWSNRQAESTSVLFSAHYVSDSSYDAGHTVSDTFMRVVGPAAIMAFITSTLVSGERKARENGDFQMADMLLGELNRFTQTHGIKPDIEAKTPSKMAQ